MPRIAGIDVPREKKIGIALRYIYGIGPSLATKILQDTGIPSDKRAKDLTDQEVASIATNIQRNYKVEGDLRREVQQNIKRFMDIKCYRGLRHIKGLPVRGQRSHTNSRTRKGPRKSIGLKIRKDAPSPS
ncbi:MAG TPA: 30S ribosomal protein S13 [Candidatus Omnitrophota bacterium]|nr:30S ribosomal protein S13 [Candidatus Omnitrophota bacterium]